MPVTETPPSVSQKHLAPIDESVVIPESVRRAAARAEAHYAPPAATDATPPADPPATPPVADATPPADPPATPPVADATPPAEPPAATPPPEVPPEQWEHRYNSMKGRFDAATQTIGSMQEQMQELGNELMRTQQVLQNQGVTTQTPQQPKNKFLTDEDTASYGPELLDVVQRAAKEAIGPELSVLQQENVKLRQSVTQAKQQAVYSALTEAVPDWEAVNRNPAFIKWLSLPDVYSGQIRKQMLGAAFQAASAPRVIAFFKGFIADEVATGNANTVPPQTQQATPPRQAAVQLETLAAPGKARPATGDTQVPADKPIFTRAQIASFYNLVRQGAYSGRDQQKATDEQMIFAAQREGRVRG